ncbi:MAG: FecR domain-containing protein [bacterium]|nr:FecR domain-containing protein [bacterium]
MKGHPVKKDIIQSILNIADSKTNEFVLAHMKECELCRDRYESIAALLRSSDNSALAPSEKVKQQIIRYHRKALERSAKKEQSPASELFKKYLRPVSFAGAALSLILVFGIIFLKDVQRGTGNDVDILLSGTGGSVRASDSTAPPGTLLSKGTVINTGENSFAEITYKDFFKVKLAANTRLLITAAQSDSSQKHRFAFNLQKGAVYSDFNHAAQMNYSFETPGAVLNSIGTQFLLSAREKKTKLFLIEGSVKVKSRSSGKAVETVAGKTYAVTSSIESRDIHPEEVKAITLFKEKPAAAAAPSTISIEEQLEKIEAVEIQKEETAEVKDQPARIRNENSSSPVEKTDDKTEKSSSIEKEIEKDENFKAPDIKPVKPTNPGMNKAGSPTGPGGPGGPGAPQ